MNVLPKVPMQAESLEPGKLYVWYLPHGEKKIVWLNSEKNGIAGYDDFAEEGEWWYFEHDLVGELFGPFEFASN